jgi:hypothetical protein
MAIPLSVTSAAATDNTVIQSQQNIEEKFDSLIY